MMIHPEFLEITKATFLEHKEHKEGHKEHKDRTLTGLLSKVWTKRNQTLGASLVNISPLCPLC